MNKNIYNSKNIWKLSLRVILPSFVVSLLFSIYVFVDRILSQYLVPINGHNYLLDYLTTEKGWNQTDIKNFTKAFNYGLKPEAYFSLDGSSLFTDMQKGLNRTLIFQALSATWIINLTIAAFSVIINSGAAVLYSRAVAERNSYKIRQIWISSFYNCLLIAFIFMVILFFTRDYIVKIPFASAESSELSFLKSRENQINNDPEILKVVRSYFLANFELKTSYTSTYFLYLIIALPLINISNLFVFFIRADGKNIFSVFVSIITNGVNIIFDLIFFIPLKLNITFGSLASLLGYAVGVIILLLYLIIKQKQLNFRLSDLKSIKLNYRIFVITLLLSLALFVRQISSAIHNLVYIPVFYNTLSSIAEKSPSAGQLHQDIQDISVTPIYSLFGGALFGIINGMRPIIASNWDQTQHKRVNKAFFYSNLISILIVIILNGIYFASLNEQYFNFFNATTESKKRVYVIVSYFLYFQFPFTALYYSSLGLFLSIGKIVVSIVIEIIRFGYFFAVLYGLSYLAIYLNNPYIMIANGFTFVSTFAVPTFTFTWFYILRKKQNYDIDPLNNIKFFIQRIKYLLVKAN